MKKSLFQFITIISLALLLCLSLRGGNMCEAPDKCPICGSGVLDHDDTDMEEKTMDVRVICTDCGWIGHKI